MTGDHFIFIPAVLIVGFVIGFIVGRRAVLAEIEARKEKVRRRKARRKEAETSAQE